MQENHKEAEYQRVASAGAGRPLGRAPEDHAPGLVLGARRLSRSGRPVESASVWREAAREFLVTHRPVQALAAVIEACFLDPREGDPADELREAARAISGGDGGNGNRLLAALDEDARTAVAMHLLPNACGGDEVFAKDDDPSPSLWFVVRGRVRATRRGVKGARASVAVVRDGGTLGLWRPLREGEGALTLVAEEPTELLELRREDFEEILRRYDTSRKIFERH